jgi:HSP20 family protein
MSLFRREMDRLFDSFFTEPFGLDSSTQLVPAINVAETDKEIVVKAELPGVDEKNISVTLSGDNLVLRGEKKEEKEEKNKHHHLIERRYGSFERVIGLPAAVDAEKVSAEFRKGVLEIKLTKKEEARRREIKVQVK